MAVVKNINDDTQEIHNQDAQPSQGSTRRVDKEQTMTKHTSHMKSPMHEQRKTLESGIHIGLDKSGSR